MKLVLEVSQAEAATIQLLEAYGWTAPANVEVQLIGGTVTTPPPVTVTAPPLATAGAGAAAAGKGGFDVIFDWLIPEEGGYTNDPNDPGGPTMYGIDTKDDAAAWQALGVTDIRNLTQAQAKTIYFAKYWNGALCNAMPTPVAETHFNFAVNTGSEQSVKFMQGALGVPIDGQYGPVTQAALAAEAKAGLLKGVALAMIDQADKFYQNLATQPRFVNDEKGWLNRNQSLRDLVNKTLT